VDRRSCLEAVNRFKACGIDCVVLELDLPDMSGFEFLIKLLPQASHPEIAVIVLTKLSNHFLLELALKNGAQAAFMKNMTSGDILDKAILKALATVQKEKGHRGTQYCAP
jgi:DNA-binding NarL/FixJ family response regulator